MKSFIIERKIPGAGKLNAEQLKDISITSCNALRDTGPGIQWVQSYVTGDTIYCVYQADDPKLILEHARRGGFPADAINEIANVISPSTAN